MANDPNQKPRVDDEKLQFVRQLRREKTEAEKKLWSRLRSRRLAGFKFRQQHPAGPYSIDFYCHEAKLGVGLDGGQHSELGQEAHDAARTAYLKSLGITVVRFWNHNVLRDTDAVCKTIYRALSEPGSVEGRISEWNG